MFRSDVDLMTAGQRLLELVDRHERGEISESELLREWKRFMNEAHEYLRWLEKQIKLN